MKQLLLAGTLAAAGTGLLIVADQHQQTRQKSLSRAPIQKTVFTKESVHAAGRIEGTTENVLIRPHFPGRIDVVAVARGQRVQKGDVLFRLESERYEALRDLARAELSAATAEKMRLMEGARASEIEAAKQDAAAAAARHANSEARFVRAQRLFERNAVSSQDVEDYRADRDAKYAILLAAQERLQTIAAAPRKAELMAADAAIASAEAQLKMAQIDLDRCTILAPSQSIVLAVEINPGEWISPEMPDAALELSNVERLRVVADVDERDALIVARGQSCQITADAVPGTFFSGTVAEIEPRMEPKKIYGGWAGERNETHTRRVWIDLDTPRSLPVGLPVEVIIASSPAK